MEPFKGELIAILYLTLAVVIIWGVFAFWEVTKFVLGLLFVLFFIFGIWGDMSVRDNDADEGSDY